MKASTFLPNMYFYSVNVVAVRESEARPLMKANPIPLRFSLMLPPVGQILSIRCIKTFSKDSVLKEKPTLSRLSLKLESHLRIVLQQSHMLQHSAQLRNNFIHNQMCTHC